MSNPFEAHGITHLSASSLNYYAEQPAFWAAKYLFGLEESNAMMWRGLAVEAGLDSWLYKRDPEAAHVAALGRFELDAMGDLDDAVDRERAKIGPMLDQAISLMGNKPTPNARQLKIEFWFDGIEVPVVGYTDYEWAEFGTDLKTVNRMPTEIPGRHARQVSLYQAARKKPYDLLYVTEKKAAVRTLSREESDLHIKRLEWHAHTMRRALAVFRDKHELAQIFVPDLDHFYWKGEAARQLAAEIWR